MCKINMCSDAMQVVLFYPSDAGRSLRELGLTRHAARARRRGLKLLRSFGFYFAPQAPGAHSVSLAYAPRGAVARSGS